MSTSLCDVLGIDYPILQSGMGGVAGPELVAEISNAGGLGILAGTLTAPDDLRAAIHRVRELTERPFAVNLLLLPEVRAPASTGVLSEHAVAAMHDLLNPIRAGLELPAGDAAPPTLPDLVSPALDVIVAEQVPVFSAGLGDPGPELTERLHRAGIKTVVMVASSGDARQVAASGADVVVAQGFDAGGHRSHLVPPRGAPLGDIGTMALVPEVVDAVDVPVVAAGGILDGRGLVAALALGAAGVLMGTRFLATRESGAPDAHKKRLLEAGGEDTVVTDMLSGRPARVVRNALTDQLIDGERHGVRPLPFPSQYLVNADVFAAAQKSGDAEHLPLWGGQATGRLNDLPWAAEVVGAIVDEARELLQRGLPERVRLS